jgi:hypothetical protein
MTTLLHFFTRNVNAFYVYTEELQTNYLILFKKNICFYRLYLLDQIFGIIEIRKK